VRPGNQQRRKKRGGESKKEETLGRLGRKGGKGLRKKNCDRNQMALAERRRGGERKKMIPWGDPQMGGKVTANTTVGWDFGVLGRAEKKPGKQKSHAK